MSDLKAVIVAVSLAVAVVCFPACGGDDDEPSGGAAQTGTPTDTSGQLDGNEELCPAVSAVESSITAVQELDENSTVAEVESALTGVEDAAEELATAAQGGAQADVSGLQASVQDLEDALKAVPTSDSVQAGLQQVEAAADSASQEAQSVADNAGCDAVPR